MQPSETSVAEPCSAPSEKYLLLDTEDELELHAMDDKAPALASVLFLNRSEFQIPMPLQRTFVLT